MAKKPRKVKKTKKSTYDSIFTNSEELRTKNDQLNGLKEQLTNASEEDKQAIQDQINSVSGEIKDLTESLKDQADMQLDTSGEYDALLGQLGSLDSKEKIKKHYTENYANDTMANSDVTIQNNIPYLYSDKATNEVYSHLNETQEQFDARKKRELEYNKEDQRNFLWNL